MRFSFYSIIGGCYYHLTRTREECFAVFCLLSNPKMIGCVRLLVVRTLALLFTADTGPCCAGERAKERGTAP